MDCVHIIGILCFGCRKVIKRATLSRPAPCVKCVKHSTDDLNCTHVTCVDDKCIQKANELLAQMAQFATVSKADIECDKQHRFEKPQEQIQSQSRSNNSSKRKVAPKPGVDVSQDSREFIANEITGFSKDPISGDIVADVLWSDNVISCAPIKDNIDKTDAWRKFQNTDVYNDYLEAVSTKCLKLGYLYPVLILIDSCINTHRYVPYRLFGG